MNYKAIHDRIIERARTRQLTGYCERHHVIPRCLGGSDEKENIVKLTPEEHYVVHQLLVKINPGVRGLVTAAIRMSRQCTGRKAYGWLRRHYSEWRKGRSLSRETVAKMLKAREGYRHSEATRQKIREANLRNGNKPPMTNEMRRLLGLRKKGQKCKPFTAEHKAKIGARTRERSASPEYRARMSAIQKARTIDPEKEAVRRAKLSASHRMRRAIERQRIHALQLALPVGAFAPLDDQSAPVSHLPSSPLISQSA